MRRDGVSTVKVLVTGGILALLSACGTEAAHSAPSPAVTVVSPAADPSGATANVCKRIRSDLATRMNSLGEALGDYLGYRAADDDDAVADASAAVTAQVKELGSAISRAGRSATDAAVRAAASEATAGIDRVAASDEFLDDIDSLSDIPAAINKISDAARPIADACS